MLFFAGAIVCLLAAGWGYYQYQKPRVGTVDVTPVFRLSAEQLYNEYNTNETSADKKYNNKVVEVSGIVKDVQTTPHATNILLNTGAEPGGVSCSFQKAEKSKATVGEHITVKGRCTGFLMDVSLVDAVRTDR